MSDVCPEDFIISRKRKKYKFAWFEKLENCLEIEQFSSKKIKIDVLEVGAGNGIFAAKQAMLSPDKIFAAVDVKADRLQEGAKFAQENAIDNVIFIRAHVNQLFEALRGKTVEKIWLTFSDPFPKKRHAKHRLTHPDFLHQYAQILAGGDLMFKTDARWFFEWSLERMIECDWMFDELSFDLHQSDLDPHAKIMTTYEARFVSENIPINFVKASMP